MLRVTVMIVATILSTSLASASIVVFAFGKKSVIVAADSRETYSDGSFKDTACKIGSYGNNVVFTHVGIASFGVTDLMAEARDSVMMSVPTTSLAVVGPTQSIAERAAMRWKDRAEALLRLRGANQLLMMTKQNGSPELAAFMFASIEANNNIAIWYATITLTNVIDGMPQLEATAQQYGVDGDEAYKLRALGHSQIFWEYAAAKTDRAKVWRKEAERDQEPSLEKTVKNLVELTISHDSEGVGGDVDRMRLDVGKGIQWLELKPGCSSMGERLSPPRGRHQ